VFLESPVSSTALGSGTNAMSLSYHIIEGFGSRWNIFTNCSLTLFFRICHDFQISRQSLKLVFI
ncbi:hypothetical protein, partial [Moorena sp. SIO3I6]|uniref:hypothetical protein n=1 Tax=Moorena sp. SIO3I6 TaxID=2607831 RepID=UPI0025CFF7B9